MMDTWARLLLYLWQTRSVHVRCMYAACTRGVNANLLHTCAKQILPIRPIRPRIPIKPPVPSAQQPISTSSMEMALPHRTSHSLSPSPDMQACSSTLSRLRSIKSTCVPKVVLYLYMYGYSRLLRSERSVRRAVRLILLLGCVGDMTPGS